MALPRRLFSSITLAFATASTILSLTGAAFAQQTVPPPGRPLETPPAPPAALEPAPAEKEPRKRFRFGPQVGLYLPTNGRTRSRFGNSWSNIGFGFGSISDIHRNRRLAVDISVIRNSRSDAKVFLAPIGLSYSIGLGEQDRSSAAYAGISANLVITSIRSDIDNLPSRTNATGGASFFLGNRFSDSGYVEARYNAIGKVRGFDLSGLNLTAGLRF